MIKNFSLRYGKAFSAFRKVVKYFLSFLYPAIKLFFKLPKVESVNETLDQLLFDSTSIVRFGDGEIIYLNDQLDLPFQKYESELATCFVELLQNNHNNLLVGLPIGYHKIDTMSKDGQLFWRSQIVWNYPRLKKYLNLKTTYANASVTRVTYGFNPEYAEQAFTKWKQILRGNRVLVVEGEKTRFGVGNDLLAGFKKIERILGPKHNAFVKADEIIKYVLSLSHNYDAILVAMGPAAKYIVYKLHISGYKVIDIGNLDIEYEWYLREAYEERILIPGKYTSEVKGGREVGDIPDSDAFEKYKNQIIASFIE